MFREQSRYGNDPSRVRRSKTTFSDPLKWKEPAKVFTYSWSDFFIDEADVWREEARLDQERRKVRSAENNNKWEVIWLLSHASKLIAERIELSGEFTRFVEEIFEERYNVHNGALADHIEDLREMVDAADEPQRTWLRKVHLVFCVLAQNIVNHHSSDEAVHYESLSEIRHRIEQMCKPFPGKNTYSEPEHFGVKLPASWDTIPVLQTAFNCWHCGKFAPSERITKRDETEGWVVLDEGVFCSNAHIVASGKTKKKVAKKAKKK